MNINMIVENKKVCSKCNKELEAGVGRYNTDEGILCVECYDRDAVRISNKLIDSYSAMFNKLVCSA